MFLNKVIGIDLDNTIINYNNAFKHTAVQLEFLSEDWVYNNLLSSNKFSPKTLIKHHILTLDDGNYKWESLQGQVYGNFIYYAKIFPGVANFLIHCRRRGNRVFVVSHKTEFGHYDKNKRSLRKAALNFLKDNDLFLDSFGITTDDILFFDTRQEKVNKIAELNCDYFIDDLPEVFAEPNFPSDTQKILFNTSELSVDRSFSSWFKINEFFFKNIELGDISAYVEKGTKEGVKNINNIKGRSNSRIFKIEMESGGLYAGKLYPDPTFDDRSRLTKEIKACKFLHSNNLHNVPEVVWSDKNLNFGLYKWIDGTELKKVSIVDIRHALKFVKTLVNLSKKTSYGKFSLASAACLSGKMIKDQIWERFQKINIVAPFYRELNIFLDEELFISIETILKFSEQNWSGDFSYNLPIENQLLSPSDFGFHNTIKKKQGLQYIDFEYFGWDDPVKLTCDFILHPSMDLTEEQKKLWVTDMTTIFSDDSSFKQRLNVSYSLYGLCWCLILLNTFFGVEMDGHNTVKSQEHHITQKQQKQLLKSKVLLMHINSTYMDGFPYG